MILIVGMKCFVVLCLFVIVAMSEDVQCSKVCSKFVRLSLDTQRKLAAAVYVKVNASVYLFDEVDYFQFAEPVTIDGIRCLRKGIKYAVLSTAAQAAFKTSNTYSQYTSVADEVLKDEIGVYLNPSPGPKTD